MFKKGHLLLVLALVQFTHIMDFMVIMPLGDTLMNAFSITPRQFSLIVSSYTLSAGVAGLASAFFIDRFDRKTALFFVYTGFVAGTLFCALAHSYEVLLVARMITGFFGGIQSALILAIIGDVFPYEKRGSAMGTVMAAFSAAAVIGVPAGYFFGIKFGWNVPFYIITVIGLLVITLIYIKIPSLRDHLKEKYSPLANRRFLLSIFSNKNLLVALLFTVTLILGQFTVIPFIAPFMERNVGFEPMEVTYIYLCGGALTLFTSPLIGRLSDRIGKKQTFTLFAVLTLLTILVITNLGSIPVVVALIITTLFFIFTSGRMIPATTLVTSVVPPANRGSFMSLNSSVQQFAAGISALIAGLIVRESELNGELINFDKVGYLAAGVSVLAIFVGWWLHEEN